MGGNLRISHAIFFSLIIALLFLLSACEEIDALKKQAQKACNYDGVVQDPELCDDKNKNPNDLCNECVPTVCGDNIANDDPYNFLRSIEQCDQEDQALADQQCVERGFLTPCQKDTCQCGGIAPPKKAVCNQNNVLDAGEECDKGSKGDSTCTPECTLTYCGDEKVQAPNGKDLNNNQPGFNEFCDAGKDPFNLTDPAARNAHAFCQAATGNPDSACVGCKCTDPKTSYSCAWGAIAAIFGGPLGPLPPGAVCQNDCNLIGPGWVCNNVNCVCQPPPPPPKPSCAENTMSTAFAGAPLVMPGAVCKDDCKLLFFAPDDVYCDPADCICKVKDEPKITCGDNTLGISFNGESPWKQGDACKDDCKEMVTGLVQAFGGSESDAAAYAENVYCDTTTCECKEKIKEDNVISCSKNERDALQGLTPVLPGEGRICRDDCKINFETDSAYCDPETCVCQRRPVTPRCGDGYLSSQWVAGGGMEECDTGGRRGYAPVPDTCPPPKVCSMEGETACKCVLVEDAIPVMCPKGTGTDSRCGQGCYPNDACEVVSYLPKTETPCYACKPKCPYGTIYKNYAVCKQLFGECVEVLSGCYGPVAGGDTVPRTPPPSTPQTPGETVLVGGGSGGDTIPSTPQPLNCEEECSKRGRTTSQPSYAGYIMNYLQQYSCVSGASIQLPGTLTLQGPAGDTCRCYSTENPSININSQVPVCQSECGPVNCGSSTSCSCGEGCTLTVSCNWGGWRQISDTQFQPIVSAGQE